ncbi:MAG: trypsin-like peptidase domain-containing protein [Luteolibacter sp.]
MVLTNEAVFLGHTPLRGASAFLVQDEKHGVIAATALHLLGENGGVEPRVDPADLDQVLKRWKLYARTKPQAGLDVGGLCVCSSGQKHYDWLALRLKEASGDLPATPLRLRAKPVELGELVHLVGVAYSEPEVAQKVYSGRVTGRAPGGRFKYDISPPVDLRGFSGAPIVDEKGLAVGVMSVWFNPKMDGDRMTEAGGEDAASLLECLDSASGGDRGEKRK